MKWMSASISGNTEDVTKSLYVLKVRSIPENQQTVVSGMTRLALFIQFNPLRLIVPLQLFETVSRFSAVTSKFASGDFVMKAPVSAVADDANRTV